MENTTPKPRALLVYVPDNPIYLREQRILSETWRTSCKGNTDYICFGPIEIAEKLDDDIIFIEHADTTSDYDGYAYANSIDIFLNPRIDDLRTYCYLMRTDTDVFLTPAFRDLSPKRFMTGAGSYVNDQITRDKLCQAAKTYGLNHRGIHNIGATWYGPTKQILRVGRLAARILRKLIKEIFIEDAGAWPSWYRGVASMYASELAINHLIDDIQIDPSHLDHPSTSDGSIDDHAHIHCWHTDNVFSKFAFRNGQYDDIDITTLDTTIVKNYCLAMSKPVK